MTVSSGEDKKKVSLEVKKKLSKKLGGGKGVTVLRCLPSELPLGPSRYRV